MHGTRGGVEAGGVLAHIRCALYQAHRHQAPLALPRFALHCSMRVFRFYHRIPEHNPKPRFRGEALIAAFRAPGARHGRASGPSRAARRGAFLAVGLWAVLRWVLAFALWESAKVQRKVRLYGRLAGSEQAMQLQFGELAWWMGNPRGSELKCIEVVVLDALPG